VGFNKARKTTQHMKVELPNPHVLTFHHRGCDVLDQWDKYLVAHALRKIRNEGLGPQGIYTICMPSVAQVIFITTLRSGDPVLLHDHMKLAPFCSERN